MAETTKDVRKSVRLSQEVYAYVESAEGKSFNDKLDRLLLDAKNGEAQRAKRIQEYDKRIQRQEEKMEKLFEQESDFRKLHSNAVMLNRQLEELGKAFKRQIEAFENETDKTSI